MKYLKNELSKLKFKNSFDDIKVFVYFSIGTIISSLFLFLTIRNINLKLSSNSLGIFSYQQSVFQLLFVGISLNLYNVYPRFNAKGVSPPLVRFVQRFSFVGVIVFSITIYLLTNSFWGITYSIIILYYERMYFYRSISNSKNLNLLLISSSLCILLVSSAYLYYTKDPDINIIFFSYGIGYAVSLLFINNIEIGKLNYHLDLKTKDIFLYCTPLLGMTIVEWVLNFSNQFLIKFFLDFESVAIYAVAFKALFPFRFLSSLFLLYFPVIYYREAEKKQFHVIKLYRKLIVVTLFFSTICMLIFSPYIYMLIGGYEYMEFGDLFKVLLIADFFRICSSFFALFLTYKIKTLNNLIFQLLTSIVSTALSIVLIPRFGIMGACISLLISFFTLFIFISLYSIRLERKYFTK